MIDWPNLIIGFVLGVAGTVPFWLADRRRARDTLEADWTRAARTIELLMWKPTTRSEELAQEIERMPIDYWRSILGPEEFRLLEALQNAYSAVERAETEEERASKELFNNGDFDRWDRARGELSRADQALAVAKESFANMARGRSSAEYTEVMRRERRADSRRHPLRTIRRSFKQWRARRKAGPVGQ